MLWFTQSIQLYIQAIYLQIMIQIPGGNNMAMAIKWNLVRYKGQGNIKVINRKNSHYQSNNTK